MPAEEFMAAKIYKPLDSSLITSWDASPRHYTSIVCHGYGKCESSLGFVTAAAASA
jgi:hypothetical protein